MWVLKGSLIPHLQTCVILVGGLLASGLLAVDDFGPFKRWRKARHDQLVLCSRLLIKMNVFHRYFLSRVRHTVLITT